MLLCDQKTFYVGISNDVRSRILQHKNKQTISTKKFSILQIVYLEKYDDKFQAAKREKQLKGWSHAKKQNLIDGILGINACNELVEVTSEELNCELVPNEDEETLARVTSQT